MKVKKQMEKAAGNHDDEIVVVMKEVKRFLKRLEFPREFDN